MLPYVAYGWSSGPKAGSRRLFGDGWNATRHAREPARVDSPRRTDSPASVASAAAGRCNAAPNWWSSEISTLAVGCSATTRSYAAL
jgi:hypothetical protein